MNATTNSVSVKMKSMVFIGIENHKSHKLYRKDQSLDSEGRELLKNIHKNDLGLVVHPKDRDSREGVFKACMKE